MQQYICAAQHAGRIASARAPWLASPLQTCIAQQAHQAALAQYTPGSGRRRPARRESRTPPFLVARLSPASRTCRNQAHCMLSRGCSSGAARNARREEAALRTPMQHAPRGVSARGRYEGARLGRSTWAGSKMCAAPPRGPPASAPAAAARRAARGWLRVRQRDAEWRWPSVRAAVGIGMCPGIFSATSLRGCGVAPSLRATRGRPTRRRASLAASALLDLASGRCCTCWRMQAPVDNALAQDAKGGQGPAAERQSRLSCYVVGRSSCAARCVPVRCRVFIR